jgi:histidine triad (HIT) family protein
VVPDAPAKLEDLETPNSLATCTFCQIVAGAVPAEVVLRDDLAVAFLDHRPLFPGHVLLAPLGHAETLPDLPEDQVGGLFERAQRLCLAVERAMTAEGTFVAINNKVSQSVPHLHVHIVPRSRGDGMKGFFWPRRPYGESDDMAAVGARIRANL